MVNEKFIELARRAALKFPSEAALSPAELKFAELIVRECIRLCDQVDIVGADECIDNIKEHFEVGE